MNLDVTIVRLLSRFEPRRVAQGYLIVQGLAVAGWWVLLVALPSSRVWFFPEQLTGAALMNFWLADLVLLAGGSWLTAWLLGCGNPSAGPTAWFLAGAFYYPAVYCLTVSYTLGGGAFGVAAMFSSGGLTLAMATVIGSTSGPPAGFRAASGSTVWIAIKSLLQILVFWTTFFVVLPKAIVALQQLLGIGFFEFPGRIMLGAIGFVLFGALGLWSAALTIALGRGTPLPTDCASVLVITGPYRFVRNPMALAGIGQGVWVGLIWGSWPVMAYALTGGLIWHVLTRPIEERDLVARFGGAYLDYQRSVMCWWPTFRFRPNELQAGRPDLSNSD